MAKHVRVIVLSFTFVIALIAVLTWAFYENAVKTHIGCTELNTWGKILVINSSLNIVTIGLSLVANMIIKSKYD